MQRHHLVLLLMASLLLSCAPDRSQGDDEDILPGTRLQNAYFRILESGENDFQRGYLVLVDADAGQYNCGTWSQSYYLMDFVPEGAAWVEINLHLGDGLDSWETRFISDAAWEERCEGSECWEFDSVAVFAGQVGVGMDWGDDDDDDDESIVGREVLGYPGDGLDDTLVITGYSESRVDGYLQSEAGDYAFYATHCGGSAGDDDDDDDDIDEPEPGPDPTEPPAG